MLTQIDGVPSKESAVPGMAYFAGTGPLGETCGGCVHRNPSNRGEFRSRNRCEKFKTFTGDYGPPILPGNASCKYFERR
jgi:hypothetical protein